MNGSHGQDELRPFWMLMVTQHRRDTTARRFNLSILETDGPCTMHAWGVSWFIHYHPLSHWQVSVPFSESALVASTDTSSASAAY